MRWATTCFQLGDLLWKFAPLREVVSVTCAGRREGPPELAVDGGVCVEASLVCSTFLCWCVPTHPCSLNPDLRNLADPLVGRAFSTHNFNNTSSPLPLPTARPRHLQDTKLLPPIPRFCH